MSAVGQVRVGQPATFNVAYFAGFLSEMGLFITQQVHFCVSFLAVMIIPALLAINSVRGAKL